MHVSTVESKLSKSASVFLRRTTLALAIAFLLMLQAKTTIANCRLPLGMQNGLIDDSAISASSEDSTLTRAADGRLNQRRYWKAGITNKSQWFQVDFGKTVNITQICTQGRRNSDERVKEYYLSYSVDGLTYENYKNKQIFSGNTNRNSRVIRQIDPQISARIIRINPQTWNSRISLRAEFYGCREGCPKALGMEDNRIPDSSLSASSAYSNYEASRGRLNEVRTRAVGGGWSAYYSTNQWFQVEFVSKVTISQIATQGQNYYAEWLKTYWISIRRDSGSFIKYNNNKIFQGNWDRNTIVVNVLEPAIVSRVIRIIPRTWNVRNGESRPALRTEFYGCRRVSEGNVTGRPISAETIHVAWQIVGNINDNSFPCGFKVSYRRATGNNQNWIVEPLEGTATQHTIRDLLAYTMYMIQVEALNGACSGTFSPAVSVTTHEKAPSAPPQGVTVVSPTYFGVLLKWIPPPNENRNGRILQYSVTAVSQSSGSVTESPTICRNFSQIDSSSEQQGLLKGLQEDTNYTVVIIASNGAGSSPPSSPVNFKTLQPQAPSAPPQNVTVATFTYFGVLLKWLPPPIGKRNGRILQYSVTALKLVTLSNGSVTESQSVYRNFSHNDTLSEQQGLLKGLQEDTNYKIVMIASTGGGSGPSSSPVSFKILHGPTVSSTTQQNTEDTLSSTQIVSSKKPTSVPTVSKGKQKDVQSGANSNMVIGLVVAAVVALVAVLLILFVLHRRRKKKGGESPKEMQEGSLYNNRVTAPQTQHLPFTEDADMYLVPVDNHKRWELLQQQTKTGPDSSSYNSEEISKHKQNDLNNMSNCGDDVYSYAAPDDLSLTLNWKENAKSAQFVQHNPIYESVEDGESKNVNISSETLQHIQDNPIYNSVTDQPSSPKETKSVFTKKPVPAAKRTKTNSPPAKKGVGKSPTIEDRSQMEPKYDVLEGPEPSSSLNNVSSGLYNEVYSTDSRKKSEKNEPVVYDVIWSSNNKPPADTKSKPKAQKTPTGKAVVDKPDLYDKLWVSGAGDEQQQRDIKGNIYDSTYDTIDDSIH